MMDGFRDDWQNGSGYMSPTEIAAVQAADRKPRKYSLAEDTRRVEQFHRIMAAAADMAGIEIRTMMVRFKSSGRHFTMGPDNRMRHMAPYQEEKDV